ncbi:SGNH/GDSL hydrolase family protein [Lysobacter soli]|uniref:SGNH/GDSL hydrolase family protein n=1 Tax=Lysobacter soli TaxID=453783 RepID=A0A3D8VEX7_9GAMM|nr:SGNH/GDSL hydrolase family protein [Lysobacter soli]QGW66509.1 SGNH/GDSL hydrolase family protein [Lysobacter soli]RDY67865.1 SGNH/GDSL hydrolase family protein [Lysobacter soli]UTA55008.1 SGNH/GDSL hydrolase family protein [Lysobacter soli]
MANAPATALSFLALGDSYTIGEGVPESGRWPVQLAKALREEGIALADPRIIATTGWTTDELAWGIDGAEPLGEWDFVTLLIGVNNQYRGRSAIDFRGEFETLLQRAIRYARGRADRVLVLSIPDWGVTPFVKTTQATPEQVATELDAYNAAAQVVCEAHEVAYVDITPISRERGAEPEMLADDGLHPSAAMYTLWTALALPAARSLLQR